MKKRIGIILIFLVTYLGVNAQQWQGLGTAFSSGQGAHTSMAMHNSTPYVVYSEQNAGSSSSFKASVKKFDGTTWSYVGSLGFSAGRANYTSIDFNTTSGEPYVAYQDVANGNKTTVKKFNGVSWVNVGTPGFSGGVIATYQCIKIDNTTGIPYVAMRYRGTGSSAPYQLKIMKFNGNTWVNAASGGVVSGVTGASGVSMFIDNGVPYVTCLNSLQSDATSVYSLAGTTWNYVSSIAVSAANADHQSIAVHNGTIYVAYRDWANNKKTTVRKFDGSSWVNVGLVGFSDNKAQYQSIAIDNSGTPYVAYSDNAEFGSGGQTTVMQFDGTNWVNTGTPNFTTINSGYQDLILDNGIPYVAYMEGSNYRASVKAYLPCVVDIPDVNLKQALLNDNTINTNNNLFIECTEAAAYSGALSLGSLSINDATGLESFTNATAIDIQNNSLNTLDLSTNIALTTINCDANGLTSLIIGANTSLLELYAEDNSLITLNVSGATALNKLKISDNFSLTSVDITANTVLQELEVINCNVIGGTELIKEIDFSQNTLLTRILIKNCGLTSVDVSSQTSLTSLDCSNNNLLYLNIANGNNANMTVANLANNTNLTCIQVDNGFTPSIPFWVKDAGASYSNLCVPLCFVTIPDANFKAYLVGNSNINTNGDAEIQCAEASAFTDDMQLYNLNISDLTGIEAFTALTELFCDGNNITTIDLSSNTALTFLRCSNNPISNLDLTNNVALTDLECSNNSLTTLDLSANVNLTEVKCSNNSISSLDLSNNATLSLLYCHSNTLTSLNLANGNNSNVSVWNFNATSNPNLNCVTVDDVNYSTINWTSIDAQTSFSTNCMTVLISSINVQGQGGVSSINIGGGTLQMEATILPTNADDATYVWSVTNVSGSATIDASGVLTALSDGSVDVTASANDASGETGTATITISNQSVDIDEVIGNTITIFPNPVEDQLFIEVEEEQINQVEVIDVSGKLIKIGLNKILNVSDLKQGIYMLKISTEKGTAFKQFVKQ